MKEIKVFLIGCMVIALGALAVSFADVEHYGEVVERVNNKGVETVTVDTEIGRMTDVFGDFPIGSRVTVYKNSWRAKAYGVGE